MDKISDDIIYGRQALNDFEPWIVPESLRHLTLLVKPDFKVFEWGSGGSTIWFARYCAHIYTVEHNTRWVDWVTERMNENAVIGHKVTQLTYLGLSALAEYANAILAYEDETFDLVFVDGERSVRTTCIVNAVSKVKLGGTLLVDNSNWGDSFNPIYDPEHKLQELLTWERHDYRAPDHTWLGEPNEWWTSLFIKPTSKEV